MTKSHASFIQTGEIVADDKLEANKRSRPLPADSPAGTTIPRHIAAVADNLFAMVGAVVIAKQFPDSLVILQIVAMVLSFLGYYLVFEAAFCATPGKYVTGLAVRDFNGGRCSLRQTLVRTAFRVIEVNPLVLGGLPAAVSIFASRDKQRFGDKIAGTVVVRR